ncbi:TrmH family RNA methyltransferase [Angustibacter aerolatus]|nr:RNA methyltransferase [Angustibacter aerolatus]
MVNPRSDRVRAVHRLGRRVARVRAGRFVAEGPQSVREAVHAHVAARAAGDHGGPVVLELYATAAAADRYAAELDLARDSGLAVTPATDEVLAAMTDTVTPQGLLAVCRTLDRPLAQVLGEPGDPASVPSLVALLAQVRDPGNAGTVIRAADAAGAGAVVLTEASVDVHNPKCVRATAGSLFHLPVAQDVPLTDAVEALRARGLVVLAADGAGDADLDDLLDDVERDARDDAGLPTALLARPTTWLLGNEAWGLPPEQRALADAVVRVPLHGRAESLNLAAAATVCLYASARSQRRAQRREHGTR